MIQNREGHMGDEIAYDIRNEQLFPKVSLWNPTPWTWRGGYKPCKSFSTPSCVKGLEGSFPNDSKTVMKNKMSLADTECSVISPTNGKGNFD